MEVTVKLLENGMRSALQNHAPGNGWSADQGRFLIDGFPRKLDQALKYEREVSPACCFRHSGSQLTIDSLRGGVRFVFGAVV
jgi:hypothetical protein